MAKPGEESLLGWVPPLVEAVGRDDPENVIEHLQLGWIHLLCVLKTQKTQSWLQSEIGYVSDP